MEGDKVQVSIRVRPLIQREKDQGDTINWWYEKNNVIQPYQPETRSLTGHPYTFDRIFHDRMDTSAVYNQVVKPLVEKSLQGYNGTVLCYGQTSSGKTHTLYGTDEEDGIISLTAKHLFQLINEDQTRAYYIRVGLLEVYNEKVSDLLNNRSHIEIKEKNGVAVPHDLKELEVLNSEDMLTAAKIVQAKRKIGETQMNKESSRSHTILRILVESVPNDNDEENEFEETQVQVTNALLNFVDLAGSEKASQTGAVGERFKEATFINKSLSVLSQVVLQLSSNVNSTNANTGQNNSSINQCPQSSQSSVKQPVPRYINYRDSKLTRILQSSLSGNAYISLICNITPAAVDETHSTLRFAKTAKNIKVGPTKNQGPPTGAQYRTKITELENMLVGKTSEVDRLRKQIFSMQKFCQPLQRVTVASLPDRRKTMCPSMLRKEGVLESRPIIDDFKIPGVPNRRSFAHGLSINDTSAFASIDFPKAGFEKRLHPLREEAAVQIKPNTVDASTETDLIDPPGETTFIPEALNATAEKWLMEKDHNQSIRQEWCSEKSFLQHEHEVIMEEKDANFQSLLTSMQERLQQNDAEKEKVLEECEKLKKDNVALEKELREYFEELHTIKIKMGKAHTENLALRQGLEELEVVKSQLEVVQSDLESKKKLEHEFSEQAQKLQEAEKSRNELAFENNQLKEDNEDIKSRLEELQSVLQDKNKFREQLDEQAEKLQLVDELSVENTKLKDELKCYGVLQEQCAQLLLEKDAFMSDLEKLKEENFQMISTQESLQEKLIEAEAEASSTKASLQAAVERAELIKANEESSLVSMKELLQQKDAEIQNIVEEFEMVKKMHATMEDELRKHLEELESIKKENQEVNAENMALKQGQEEFEDVKSQMKELQSDLQDKIRIQDMYNEQVQKFGELEKLRNDLACENNFLKDELTCSNSTMEKLQEQYSILLSEKDDLTQKLINAEAEAQSTKLAMQAAIDDVELMKANEESSLDKTKELLQQKDAEMQNVVEECEIVKKIHATMEDELRKYLEELESIKKENQEVNAENMALKQGQEEFEDVKSQMKELQSDLQDKIRIQDMYNEQVQKFGELEKLRNELVCENNHLKDELTSSNSAMEKLQEQCSILLSEKDGLIQRLIVAEAEAKSTKLSLQAAVDHAELMKDNDDSSLVSMKELLQQKDAEKQNVLDEFEELKRNNLALMKELRENAEELDTFKTEILALEQGLEAFEAIKSQLVVLQSDLDCKKNLQDEFNELVQKLQDTENSRNELCVENDKLTQQYEIVKSQLAELHSEFQDSKKFQVELEQKAQEFHDLERLRNELACENKQLKDEWENMKSRLEELQAELQVKNTFQDELNQKPQNLQDLEKPLNELATENNDLREKYELVMGRVEELESNLQDNVQFEDAVNQKAQELQDMEKSRNELAFEYNKLTQEHEIIKSQLAELLTELKDSKKFQDELNEKVQELHVLEKSRNELTFTNNKLTEDYENVTSRLQELQSDLQDKKRIQDELNEIAQELQNVEKSRKELIFENNQLKEKYELISGVQEELQSDLQDKKRIQDECNEISQELQNVEKSRKELIFENNQLKEKYELISGVLEELQSDLQDKKRIQDEFNEIAQELQNVEKSRKELIFENNQLKEKYELISGVLEELQSDLQDKKRIQDEFNEIAQELQNVEKSRKELIFENNQLKEKYEHLSAELEELKSDLQDKTNFQDEFKEQAERLLQMEKSRNELSIENDKLKEERTNSNIGMEKLQDQCAHLVFEKDDLMLAFAKLKQEYTQLQCFQEKIKEKLINAEAEANSTKVALQSAVDHAELMKVNEESSLISMKQLLQQKDIEKQNVLDECEELKKNNSALMKELREAADELDTVKIEMDNANAELSTLKLGLEEFGAVKSQLELLQSDLEAKKKFQDEFNEQQKLGELEKSRNELVLENNQLKVNNEDIKSRLEELQSEFESKSKFQDEVYEQAEKIQILEKSRDEFIFIINKLKEERSISITDLEKLQEQCSCLLTEKNDAIFELEKSKNELSRIISSHLTLQEKLIVAETETSSTKQSLQAVIDHAELIKTQDESSLVSMKQLLQQKETEKQNILELCDKLQESNAALEQELRMQSDLQDKTKCQDELKQQAERLQQLEKSQNDLFVENDQLKQERTNSIIEMEKLQEQCSKLLVDKAELVSELEKLNQEYSQIISSHSSLQERLVVAQAETTSAKQSVQAAVDQWATIHADFVKSEEESKKQLAKMRLEKDASDSDWRLKHDELSSDVHSAHKEIKELQAKLHKSDCQLKEVHAELTSSKQEVSKKLAVIADLQERLQVEESKENQPVQSKPKLRSVGVETSSSIDIDKQRRYWQIQWERSEHIRKKETKELKDDVYYKSEEIKNLTKKLNQTEEMTSRLSTNVLYLEGEVDRYKELVPAVVDKKETEVQCDIIKELMFRVKRGDKFKLPDGLGFPDYPALLEEARNLQGEVSVLKFWQSKCSCNKQGHLSRSQARVPDHPRRRVPTSTAAVTSEATSQVASPALSTPTSQNVTMAPSIVSSVVTSSTASYQQPHSKSKADSSSQAIPPQPMPISVFKRPKFDPFSEPLISLEELSKNF